jgi:hypothetical protein
MSSEEQGTPAEKTVVTKRSPASTPRTVTHYKLGDNPYEYFKSRKCYVPVFPTSHAAMFDDLDAARTAAVDCLFEYLSACEAAIGVRAKVIQSFAQFKHDTIVASKFTPSAETLSAGGDALASTGSAATAPGDTRKSRMEGIDVTSLPAGFGKRRPSGVGPSVPKRARTPVEEAPSIDPGSNIPTPR